MSGTSASLTLRRRKASRLLPHVSTTWARILIVGVVWLAVLLAADDYLALVATYTVLWSIMASSWNIFSGYAGLVSFGHAVFWGLGGYTVTLGLLFLGLSPWLGLLAAAFVGAAAALLVGVPTLRLSGAYYGLSMLAYSLVMLLVFTWLGFQEVPLPLTGRDPLVFLNFSANPRIYGVVALAFLLLVLALSARIERSPMGWRLGAVKQDPAAAEAAGVNTFGVKLRASVLSGAIAAVGGGLYVLTLSVALPEALFGLLASAQAVVLTLFGGVGIVWGPVIGSVILVPLAQILNSKIGQQLPGIQGLVYGLALIATVVWAPDGLYWKVSDWWSRREPRRQPKGEVEAPVVAVAPPWGQNEAARPGGSLLELRSISRHFGGLRALDDVSFVVAARAIHGVIGPNGAGKTTLFNVINGFLRPTSGEIVFAGNAIAGLQPHDVHALGLGRTFQIVRPFSRWSLIENVRLATLDQGLAREAATELAVWALERVGLLGRRSARIEELTAGELRLMELARAVAGRPHMILLDETLAGLTERETERMLEIVRELRADGITIMIIEHTMSAMVKLVDTLTVLDHGRKIAEGTPSDVVADPVVIEAYLGRRWRPRVVS